MILSPIVLLQKPIAVGEEVEESIFFVWLMAFILLILEGERGSAKEVRMD